METARPLIQRILVPVDGSSTALNAARFAIRVAQTYMAELCFIYVVDSRSVEKAARLSGDTQEGLGSNLKAQGQRYLNYAAKLAAEAGQRATIVLREGVPQREITGEARRRRADLIVIGRVGQRGPRRILIGSVAERVIEYAPCPVLVIQR